eukprot:3813450-Alexandrium_andersonii.AAC.1
MRGHTRRRTSAQTPFNDPSCAALQERNTLLSTGTLRACVRVRVLARAQAHRSAGTLDLHAVCTRMRAASRWH